MNPIATETQAFNVIGISCRTINKDGQSGKDIGQLWHEWMSKSIMAAIPGKTDQGIYNIYTEYESDHNGYYTVMLGCKVSSLDKVPEGLVGRLIPATTCNLYAYEGKVPDCVMATWQHIWTSVHNRKYSVDFDYYEPVPQDSTIAKVKTYISVI